MKHVALGSSVYLTACNTLEGLYIPRQAEVYLMRGYRCRTGVLEQLAKSYWGVPESVEGAIRL